MHNGTVMKGVLDEYSLLPYDSVFVHINLQRGEAERFKQKYFSGNSHFKQN